MLVFNFVIINGSLTIAGSKTIQTQNPTLASYFDLTDKYELLPHDN
jgi:hypothetical protein